MRCLECNLFSNTRCATKLLMKRKKCQTTDNTHLRGPTEVKSKQGEIITSSPETAIAASLLSVAVHLISHFGVVALVKNTIVDVYYRNDSMK